MFVRFVDLDRLLLAGLGSALVIAITLAPASSAEARSTPKKTYPVTVLEALDVEVFLACHEKVEEAAKHEERDERLIGIFTGCGFKGREYSDWRVLRQSIHLACNDYNTSSIKYVVKDGRILSRSKGSVMAANRRVLARFKSRLGFFCSD